MEEKLNHISRGPRDRTRVDVDQEWECAWWSKGWGVPVDEMREAISVVGPMVSDIDGYLRKGKTA